MNSPLIFLTGCINPNGMILTKLQDPEVRRKQYLDTIKFYLDQTTLPILFVENSNVDICSEFEDEIKRKRLEVLTFNGNKYDKNMGKGYGEMLIIEYALNNSIFFKIADRILKITGRYKVLNIDLFLKKFELKHYDLNVDLKFNLIESDSRFWLAKQSFFEHYLLKYKSEVNDLNGVYFEHALCKACLRAIADGYSYSTLRTWRRYYAISGTNNKTEYESSVKWFLKNVRHLIRYYMLTRT